MGRKKQWWLALVVAAVVAVGGGTWWFIDARKTDSGQGTSAGAATSVAQPVTLGTVSRTVSVSGTFTPTHVANLNFGSGGTVTAVTATVGEKVTAGEKLATIDATSLKAEVTADQASLTAAQAQLTSAESSDDSSQLSSAKAQVTAAEAKLTAAKQAVTDATLRSTVSGTVAAVNLTVGDQVSGTSSSSGTGGGGAASSASGGASQGTGSSSSSSAQVVVVDTTKWTVDASVSAAELSSIKKGQVASVSVSSSTSSDTTGRQFFGGANASGGTGSSGRTGSSGSTGNSGTTSSGGSGSSASSAASYTGTVTTVGMIASTSNTSVATFPVTIVIDGSHTGLYDGTSATALITTSQQKNVLSVPTAAISTSSSGTPTVTVQDGKATKQVTVTVGGVYGTRTQILSGVSAGQLVVVASRNPFGTQSGSSRSGSSGSSGGLGGFGGGGGFSGGGGNFPGGAPGGGQ